MLRSLGQILCFIGLILDPGDPKMVCKTGNLLKQCGLGSDGWAAVLPEAGITALAVDFGCALLIFC